MDVEGAQCTPWHDAAMQTRPPLHRPPRHPQAWWPCLLVSQALVAWVWWRFGTRVGLPLMFASHGVCWWGVMWPRSRLFSPVLSRLPTNENLAWLSIDDGPSADTREILDLLDARGAKATFFLVGERAAQRPDDVRDIARPALRHRITLAPELQIEGQSPDDALHALLAKVEAPRK